MLDFQTNFSDTSSHLSYVEMLTKTTALKFVINQTSIEYLLNIFNVFIELVRTAAHIHKAYHMGDCKNEFDL